MRIRWQQRRTGRLALPAAIVLALLIVATTPPGAARGQTATYPLAVGVATCDSAPRRAGMLDPECVTSPDIALEVWSGPRQDAGSRNLGTCVTRAGVSADAQATCEVSVPFDTPLYVYYADETTIPAGYAPLDYPLFVPMTNAGVAPYPAPVFIINVPAALPALEATPPPVGVLSLTVESFTCAPGATAATVPAGCAPAPEGFSLAVASLAGVTAPATLGEADRVGDAYVLDDAVLRSRGLFGRLAIIVDGLPPGYAGYVVTGDAVTYDADLGQYVLDLPLDAPRATVKVYAIASPTATPGTAPLPAASGLEIAIRDGHCETPGGETAIAALADLTPPLAETGGASGSPTVEIWRATLPLTLAILSTGTHAIEIRSATGASDAGSAALVCGPTEGESSVADTVTVDLRGVGGNPVSGIAYLSPSEVDPTATAAIVFLAKGGDDTRDGTQGAG